MARLALDLGWTFGWCLLRKGGRLTSGFVNLEKGNLTHGLRLLAKTQWLTSTLGQLTAAGERLDAVFHEEITFIGNNSVKTPHAHGKQLGTVDRWCALKKVPEPRGIEWDVVKKHVTGHRSAARETVLAEMQRRYPEAGITDHNEASARGVMLTSLDRFPA